MLQYILCKPRPLELSTICYPASKKTGLPEGHSSGVMNAAELFCSQLSVSLALWVGEDHDWFWIMKWLSCFTIASERFLGKL